VVNRTYTYIVMSVGFLLAIAGFLMLGFSGAVAGIAVCFLGLVLFGLSFVPYAAPPDDAPQQMS